MTIGRYEVPRLPLDHGQRRVAEALIGLLMLPLTALPIVLYLHLNPAGQLMELRGRYALAPPATPPLTGVALGLAQDDLARSFRGVPVLVYHGIGRGATDSFDRRFIITRDHFAEQMRVLQTAGYHPVTTRELATYLASAGRSRLPRKPVLITFDDGREDAVLQATPILRATGMSATMFVIAGRAESGSFYYAGIGQLRGSGVWELGNHTFDLHRAQRSGPRNESLLVLARPGESLGRYAVRVGADLDHAQRDLSTLGRGPVAFSYPFGDWGAAGRATVATELSRVLRSRFRLAFDQDGQSGWRPAMPGDDPLHVHRLEVMDWPGDVFLRRLQAAERLGAVVWAERGLGHRYSAGQLRRAAARVACVAGPTPEPVRSIPVGTRRIVALTFDGGPSPFTPQILDQLQETGARATFFSGAAAVEGHRGLVRRLLAEGSELGVLTGSTSTSGVAAETSATAAAIRAAAPPFRPCFVRPEAAASARTLAAAAVPLGTAAVLWSVDSADRRVHDADAIARTVIGEVRPGAIVRLHDGGSARWWTVQALPRILWTLKACGYRVVTVSQLRRDSARTPFRAGADAEAQKVLCPLGVEQP